MSAQKEKYLDVDGREKARKRMWRISFKAYILNDRSGKLLETLHDGDVSVYACPQGDGKPDETVIVGTKPGITTVIFASDRNIQRELTQPGSQLSLPCNRRVLHVG